MEHYSIEESENVTILYPNFEAYIQQISIRIDSALDEKIPVTMQLSNGNQYYLDSAVTRTYLFRPAKITWIALYKSCLCENPYYENIVQLKKIRCFDLPVKKGFLIIYP